MFASMYVDVFQRIILSTYYVRVKMDALYFRLWHDVVWCAIAKYYPQSYSMGVKSKLYTKREKSTMYNIICEYVFDTIVQQTILDMKRKKIGGKKRLKFIWKTMCQHLWWHECLLTRWHINQNVWIHFFFSHCNRYDGLRGSDINTIQ